MQRRKKVIEPKLQDKIITTLERINHLFRNLLWEKSKETGLSPIQIQFLLFLDSHSSEHRRVSQLAQEFSLTQATVSDSIKSLRQKELVIQKPSTLDGRVLLLDLTPTGKKMVRRISPWSTTIQQSLNKLSPERLEQGHLFLLEFIVALQRSGAIIPARMCLICQHFRKNSHDDPIMPHHCSLLDIPMGIRDLKIDCPVHKPARTPDTP